MSGCFGRWRGMKRSGRCEERECRQEGRSIARATRGLRRPSLDARSLAQPCYLPEEQHRPQGREKVEDEDRMESGHSMRAVRDNPAPRPKVETGHRDGGRKERRRSLDNRSLGLSPISQVITMTRTNPWCIAPFKVGPEIMEKPKPHWPTASGYPLGIL